MVTKGPKKNPNGRLNRAAADKDPLEFRRLQKGNKSRCPHGNPVLDHCWLCEAACPVCSQRMILWLEEEETWVDHWHPETKIRESEIPRADHTKSEIARLETNFRKQIKQSSAWMRPKNSRTKPTPVPEDEPKKTSKPFLTLREQFHLSRRDVAALLDNKEVCSALKPHEAREYQHLADGNVSQAELAAHLPQGSPKSGQ